MFYVVVEGLIPEMSVGRHSNLGTLFFINIETFFYPLLKAEHHRASRIDDFDVVAFRHLIGRWWFTMCTQQHLHVFQLLKFLVGYYFQSFA